MAGIKIDKFSGVAPKVSPELLPDRFAQIAKNCKLISGDLVPFPQPFWAATQLAPQDLLQPFWQGTKYDANGLFALYDPKDETQRRWLLFKNAADIVVYSGADDDEGRFYYTDGEGARVSTYRVIENNWILLVAQFPILSGFKDSGWFLLLSAAESSIGAPLFYDLGLPIPPNDAKLTTEIVSYAPPTAFKFWRDPNGIVTVKSYNLSGTDRVIGDGFVAVDFKRENNIGSIRISGYNHGLTGGESVRLDYQNGTTTTVTVISVPDAKTFTYADAGPNFDVKFVWQGRVQGSVATIVWGSVTVKLTVLVALGTDTLVPHGLKDQSPVTITGMSYYEASYVKDTNTTLTITLNNHGLANGAQVVLDSFTGVDPSSQTNFPGQYEVQNATTNTFKITFSPPYVAALSGTCHVNLSSFNTLSAPITVIDDNTFTYFAPGFEIGSASDFKTPPTNAKITYGAQASPRTYVYTYVTPWGEESVPSKPSDEILVTEAQPVIVRNIPTVPPTGRNFIRGVRVYRTVPSPSGTDYYRLATCWFPNKVAGYSRTNNVSRVITADPHNLAKDDRFRLQNCTDSSFNVSGAESPAIVVTKVIDRQTFEFAQTGSNVAPIAFVVTGDLYLDVSEDQPNKPARYWGDPTVGTYDFRDDFNARDLSLVLESTDYAPPPEKLTGLTAIQNDVMAGFVGHEIYFSEIRKPHAWPIDFRVRLDYDIVGLVAMGGDTLVLTDGYPYVVSGNDPSTMVPEKLNGLFPCTSKRSVVRMPYGVVYATYDGLAVYSPQSGTQLITQYGFDADVFTLVDTSTIIAMAYRNRYIAKHSTGGFIFEIDGETPRFVNLDGSGLNASAMWYDTIVNKAYYTTPKNSGDLVGIYEWDNLTAPPLTFEWKSKVFVTKEPLNLGAAKIEADFETGSTIVWNNATEQTWDGDPPPPPPPPPTSAQYGIVADVPTQGFEIYDADTDALITSLWPADPISISPRNIQYDPNGDWVAVLVTRASGLTTAIKVYDASTYSVLQTINYTSTVATNSAFRVSPDGRFLAYTYGVYDTTTWSSVFDPSSDADLGAATDIAFSPDGNYMAIVWRSGNSPNVKVYATSTWNPVALTFTDPPFDATGCDFSPDGQYLRIAGAVFTTVEDTVLTVSTSTWTEVSYFQVTTSANAVNSTYIGRIRHSNDGQYLAMPVNGGDVDTIWLIDVYDLTTSPPSRVAITPPASLYSETGAAPVWRPDDSEILVPVDNTTNEPQISLYRIDTATWTMTPVFASYYVSGVGSYATPNPLNDRACYAADYAPATSPPPPTPPTPTPSPTPEWTSAQTWGINNPVTFKLWANKVLVATRTVTSNAIFRLPTGFKADKFELGVEGNVRIRSIHIAETPRGLKEI